MKRTFAILTLITGLLIALATIGFGALGLSLALSGSADSQSLSTDRAGASVVVVANECGSIALLPAESDTVRSSAETTWTLRAPVVRSERSGDAVVVEALCSSGPLGLASGTELTVEVPTGMDVEAKSAAGSVRAEQLTGDLQLSSQAGSITGSDLRTTDVDASTAAGRVRLDFAVAPEQVRATSQAGGVEVLVPDDDAAYRVDASTNAGSTRVDVPTDPGGPRAITARTSAGSVTVAYRD